MCNSDDRLVTGVERLIRIGRFKIGIGVVAAVAGLVTAISTYSRIVPAPEVYMKSTIATVDDLDPPKDPKSEIKIRTNGGSPLIFTKMHILKNGQIFSSFKDVLPTTKGSNEFMFRLSSESKNLLKDGENDRRFSGKVSMVLATYRPNMDNEDVKKSCKGDGIPRGEDWQENLRNELKGVTIVLEYK